MARLSSTIPSARERERSQVLSEQQTVMQQIVAFLYRHHSVKNAVYVAVLVCLIPLDVALFLGAFVPTNAPQSGMSQSLIALGQLGGALYAAILVVLIFAIQLHAQRRDEGAFMVPYLARRLGTYWLASFALGVAGMNTLFLIPHHLGVSPYLPVLFAANAVLMPSLLLLTLIVFGHAVTFASKSTFEGSFDVFRRDMAHALAVDQYDVALRKAFEDECHRSGIALEPYAWWTLRGDDSSVVARFGYPPQQYVSDVNIESLRRLGTFCAQLPPNHTFKLMLGVGDTSHQAPCAMVVRGERAKRQMVMAAMGGAIQGEPASPEGNEERTLGTRLEQQLLTTIRGLFVSGQPVSAVAGELNEFLERFGDRLVMLAKDGASVQFARTLGLLRELVQHWARLSASDEPTALARRFPDQPQRFAGPMAVDLHEVLRKAIVSNDPDKVEAILTFLGDVEYDGFEARHLRLFYESLRLQRVSYLWGIENEPTADQVGLSFDAHLHSCLGRFKSRLGRLFNDRSKEAEHFDSEKEYLTQALTFGLHLVLIAMECGRAQDAGHYAERLVEYRRHEHRRMEFVQGTAPVAETVDTLHDYVLVMCAAAAHRLLERQWRDSKDAALAVLGAIEKYVPPRHELIALWELYHQADDPRAAIDSRLEIERWELSDSEPRRVGVTYSTWGGDAWRYRGFLALLLRAEQPYPEEALGSYFSVPPRPYLWRLPGASEQLAELVKLDAVGIPEAKREAALAEVTALLDQRQVSSDKARLVELVSASISDSATERLKEDIHTGLDAQRSYLRGLRGLGVGPREVVALPVKAVREVTLPRQYLLHDESASGLGDHLAEPVVWLEAARLCSAIEQVAVKGGESKALASLRQDIRVAKLQLEENGLSPTVVFVPRQARFAAALFQRPLWEVRTQSEFENDAYGEWEGLQVVKWPYRDPRSIVIADSARLLGVQQWHALGVRTDIHDTPEAELQAYQARANEIVSREDVFDAQEVFVTATICALPALGIADPNAAIALSITQSDGCYVMRASEATFHRPTCAEILNATDLHYSLIPHLDEESAEERAPCELCHPERWDAEEQFRR